MKDRAQEHGLGDHMMGTTSRVGEFDKNQAALERDEGRGPHLGTKINAGSSIFFDIPPEIRNIIYRLVLGCHRFHVYASEAQLAQSNALKPIDDVVAVLYTCELYANNPGREWLDAHLPCFCRKIFGLPSVDLLRVSKQVYHEAALVPYSANTFIFVAPSSFNAFITKAITPVQARAIRSIAIWSPIAPGDIIDPNVSWEHWSVPPAIRDQDLLRGLHSFQLNFSIYDEASLDRASSLGGILEFGRTVGRSLRDVEVAMTCDETMRKDEAGLDPHAVGSFVQAVTGMILAKRSYSGVGSRSHANLSQADRSSR